MDLSLIKKIRLEKGMTQSELANKLNVSSAYIQQIESNKKNPSMKTLKKLTDALSIDLKSLMVDDFLHNQNHGENITLPYTAENYKEEPHKFFIDSFASYTEFIDSTAATLYVKRINNIKILNKIIESAKEQIELLEGNMEF